MTATVRTIYEQLLALGINRKLGFVAWDDNTLKVSRALNGALIRYNAVTDLYDIIEYDCAWFDGNHIEPLRSGVHAESLLDALRAVPSLKRHLGGK
jgi:hypothetical protein